MQDGRTSAAVELSETGFPVDFAWGAATAAYQVEGGAQDDGKGESIWDRFSRMPGAIADGTTGDVACDHYHRWQEDLELVARLNLNAYRFSIAWARVLPEGRGKLNAAGLDFYERLIEGLLARRIVPFITLYHWDLPQALQDRGGWQNRDTAYYFADFAAAVARRLGERASHWITLNEPRVVVNEGHITGRMAPGLRDRQLFAPVAHHLLLAHGLALQALRAETPGVAAGITLDLSHIEAATDRESDVAAADTFDGLAHRWFLDPLFHGRYPADIMPLAHMRDDLVRAGDLATVSAPLDFLGVNYYTRTLVRAGRQGPTEPVIVPPSGPLTTMGWEVYPDGLRAILMRLHAEYSALPLYITENGAAYPDVVGERGEVHDPERVRYLRTHLQAAREAVAAGVPLRGYFAWSLIDNFEWAYGHTQRFGIAYTNYRTQARIVKDSGRFLSRVAATNGGALEVEG